MASIRSIGIRWTELRCSGQESSWFPVKHWGFAYLSGQKSSWGFPSLIIRAYLGSRLGRPCHQGSSASELKPSSSPPPN